MYVCGLATCSFGKGYKMVSDTLKLELKIIFSFPVGGRMNLGLLEYQTVILSAGPLLKP